MEIGQRGFTLIHLVIVIVAAFLLFATAVTGFKRATLNTQIAQSRQEMYAISVALENYKVEEQNYPWMNDFNCSVNLPDATSPRYELTLERLTTPIAYLTGIPGYYHPFGGVGAYRLDGTTQTQIGRSDYYARYFYFARNDREHLTWGDRVLIGPLWYGLQATGPDQHQIYVGTEINSNAFNVDTTASRALTSSAIYNATNGTVSRGSIWRIGGVPQGTGSLFGLVIQELEYSNVSNWQSFDPQSSRD